MTKTKQSQTPKTKAASQTAKQRSGLESQPNLLALGPLDEAIAYRIYRVSRLLRQHLSLVLQGLNLDLSSEQYFLLYRISQQPGSSQQALADPVLGDYPNITRLLDGLEKKGLVLREPDPNDRRRHCIRLSPTGSQAMVQAAASIPQVREELFGHMSPTRLQALNKSLNSIQDQVLALRPKA